MILPGTFGRVLECWDRQMQEYVAVKVIRNVQKYRDAAMIEIEVLSTLAKHDKLSQRSGRGYRVSCGLAEACQRPGSRRAMHVRAA